MARHSKSIDIDAPVTEVYDRWSRWEQLNRYLPQIRDVQRTGADTLHWTVSLGGMDVEWDARVTAMEPNRRIAWESTSGFQNKGEVSFEELGPERTRVTVTAEYEPPLGASEGLFGIGGKIDEKLEEGLENVKEAAEAGSFTGAAS